ncbi:hypothetical protein [Rubritalea squalenifaciens]|nr:hypothetical protein [Rubritalea squalenifaciens]
MKIATMLLLALCTSALGLEPTKLKATASRVDGESDQFAYRIDYESEHPAKLGVRKGLILQQRIVKFYDGEVHVGSYFYWQEIGSHLPSAIISQDLLVKPAKFTEVRFVDRFYDVNWRDGRWSEEELGKWFTQTWHLFNSCNLNKDDYGYYLCAIEDVPRMEGYLKGSGFTIFAVLEHTFTLPNKVVLYQKAGAEQAGAGQPATSRESEIEP